MIIVYTGFCGDCGKKITALNIKEFKNRRYLHWWHNHNYRQNKVGIYIKIGGKLTWKKA